MKRYFPVKYTRVITCEGTIEAETLQEAERLWDEGYTPSDEKEVDSSSETLIHLKEAE